ncbi:helix-turn-helix domain-containing protein [Tumebacillus permanentifrigoris]|uniref:Tetratricopeptide repeat protein n=1 Tax=Tumebacillus permanentifrigoris TaxID=378543 RepID=A0A316DI32_9BACL|nr:tetratricopeptide repeat protein [Tumebacillus permanentifrigoris]PWK16273.1 tetratricopeptide repeat protein [Tumebacillus permanentifrigoris]
MNYLTLGQKLRLKRKELNLTLKDVAGDYISTATLSLVERDMQVPSEDLLRYLADKLQSPYQYFRETPEETLNRRAKTLLAEAEVLLYRKRFGMAARFAEEILVDAKDLKIMHLIGQSSLLLGQIASEKGEYHQANQYLFEAQSATIMSGNVEWLPSIYFQFGMVSFKQSYYAQALDYFKQAEQTECKTIEDDLTRLILSMISQAYHKLGQFDLALQYAERTRELVSRMNNLEAYAESLILIGATYREQEQYDQAFALFQEAQRVIHQVNAQQELSEISYNLASLFVKSGNLEEANRYYVQTIDLKLQQEDASVVNASLELVETLIQAGDLQAALQRLESAIALMDQFGIEEERARALALRYQLLHLTGNPEDGRASLEESLYLTRKLPFSKRVADTLVRLGRICANSGDASTATLLFAEALVVYENCGIILSRIL